MKKYQHNQAFGPAIIRLADVMAHTKRYAFKGVSRLAADARVNASSVSRILNGKMNPSFLMIARLRRAVEQELGFPIDSRDLVAEWGAFKTTYVCEAVRCPGCLPQNALDEFGELKPKFEGVLPGTWVTSKYPNGYQPSEEAHE